MCVCLVKIKTMVIKKISKILTSIKTIVIAVKRFFFDNEQKPLWDGPNRYSTCLRIGFEAKDKGPFKSAAGQNISLNCYCLPDEPYVFNNVPISNRLNPLFNAKLSKLKSTRKYGPPGVTTVAHNAQFFTVKWGRNNILWGSSSWF